MLLKITLFGVFDVIQFIRFNKTLFSTYCTLVLLRLDCYKAHCSEKRRVL